MKYYSCPENNRGKFVLELLAELGETLPDTPCGGRGSCGKCRMKLKGALSEPEETERALLGDALCEGIRLICLTRALGDFEYEAAREIGTLIETDFKSDEKKPENPSHGNILAVDIGTTTIAAYRCDAVKGIVTAGIGRLNPQRVHGADVISRLVYAEEGGEKALENEINQSLCDMAGELGMDKVDSAVICGNTAMEHFLCGEDPRGIAKLPFAPATLFGMEYELDVCKNSYIAPCIAAYIGGDITLGALACGLDKVKELTLYIDIGTNGEILLANEDRMLCCAAAAGPAFEGGNIECGMMASEGAVCRVYKNDDSFGFDTIDGAEPKGICGSALIDALAVFLELELMDETGMLSEERIKFSEGVYISRKDIRALQSAKAAIAAGVKTLCHEMKCRVSDITRVIIAGGFGTHISPDSAKRIGLIPYGCEGEIEFAGNCAGKGAVMLALDPSLKPRLEGMCERMEYTELSGHKKFNEYYIDEMYFEE